MLENTPLINSAIYDENLLPAIAQLACPQPLFFENVQYQFEWIFRDKSVVNANIVHPSRSLVEGFRFVPASEHMPARLTGTLDTQNNIGELRLLLQIETANKPNSNGINAIQEQTLVMQVLSTKMDMQQDLPEMYRHLEQHYPLWMYSFPERTQMSANRGKERGDFSLFWLANFNSLREQLQQGLAIIANAPHARLQKQQVRRRAEQLSGRLPNRLMQRIAEDKRNAARGVNVAEKRYVVEQKQLSFDTPENRFIKSVLIQCRRQLQALVQRFTANAKADSSRLSLLFVEHMQQWQEPLTRGLAQPFMQHVAVQQLPQSHSLTLKQKNGYGTVFRVWLELSRYLQVLGSHSAISTRSVAKLYEVWCFLKVKCILTDELGFEEVAQQRAKLQQTRLESYEFTGDNADAFRFKHSSGLLVNLYHERTFRKNTGEVRSLVAVQRPDIVLELEWPDRQRHFILFDAKYRIATNASDEFVADNGLDNESDNEADNVINRLIDYAPVDAINQMHRYRDALIHVSAGRSGVLDKSRPVLGAFVLYPGYFQQQFAVGNNPYYAEIQQVGIGAFPLLPTGVDNGQHQGDANMQHSGSRWLQAYLAEQLLPSVAATSGNGGGGEIGDDNNNIRGELEPDVVYERMYSQQERFYINEAARIPFHGMYTGLYRELTLTVALGSSQGRTKQYVQDFHQGAAQFYHIPVSTFEERYRHSIAHEIRFLAVGVTSANSANAKEIEFVYPVSSLQVLSRRELTVEQTGKAISENDKNADDSYYLFTLGCPIRLTQKVTGMPLRSTKASIKLTELRTLTTLSVFKEIRCIYRGALA